MAQFASADFTASDSTELSAADADFAKITGATGNLRILSNRVVGDSGATAAYYHSADPGTADYSVSCDVVRHTTGTESGAGVLGRASTGAQTYYHARWNAGQVQLYKFVAGAATLLGSAYTTGTLTVGTPYLLTLVMEGDQISVEWEGVTRVGPVTDTAITGSGYAGLRFLAGSIPSLDNFSGDTLAAGSPPAGTVTISGVTPGVTTASVTYSYDDTDEDSFEYRIDGGTAAAIGASPATITGLTASTTYDIEVRAINADGESAWSTAFEFTTSAANAAPSWSGTPSAMSAKRGQALTPQDITSLVSDPTPDTLTYSLGGTPPTGVTIDSSTGIISGTPTSAPGVYSTTVLADDGVNSPVASTAFDITVTQCVLALGGVGYEFLNGNSAATAAVVASTTLNVAAYPVSEWPPASAIATASGATDADGNLADLGDDDLIFGTTYRLVARNPSDGETWAWTMTAS